MRHLDRLLHLRGCIGEDVGIWTGSRPVAETRVDKEAGRAPEQLNPCALLFFFEHLYDGVEVTVRLCEAGAFRRNVPVVKSVERCSQFLDEFEGDARPIACILDGVRAVVPRANGRSDAKRVAQYISESVPVDHGKAEMIGHGPALDEFGSIVVLKGERVPGGWTFVGDLADFWECGVHKRAAGLFLEIGWNGSN